MSDPPGTPRQSGMHPDLRIAIRRDGIVRAKRWRPPMQLCGPAGTAVDARGRAGVTLGDLTFVRDEPNVWDAEDRTPDEGPIREVIATLFSGDTETARDALTEWASLVGIGRLWLPGEVRDVQPAERGPMQSRCSDCHNRLVDNLPSFWNWVERHGHFPPTCPLCGGLLPQWRPVRAAQAAKPKLYAVAGDRNRPDDLPMSDRRQGGRP